jgi:iron complex outermembrane receptor protein
MFKRTKVSLAVLTLAAASVPVAAQQVQRVEITGSAIKQIDAETAVPITIIKMEDLKSQGVASIEQIMSSLSAVQLSTGSSQQVGSGTGGAAFADLRGVGRNKTLVLLNGRRVANNAIDGSAPDLNMIPFAALDRVEVLRDGASSLYGTDAIGGVINFITRRDFAGGAITIGADVPAEKGGKSQQANVGFGFGDLGKSGFNLFGFIDVNKTDPIGGQERPFNDRLPGGLSPTPFPANYFQSGEITANPAGPECNDPTYLVPVGDGSSCYIATARFVDYTAESERVSAMLRGNLRVGSDHTLSLEWFGSQNKSTTRIAPVPYGTLWMNPQRPDGSPNPFFPGNPGAVAPGFPLDPNYTQPNMNPRPGVQLQPGFITVKWRALAGGQRTNISDNKQQRLVAMFDGFVGDWDYQTALSYNENKIKENVTGYTDGNKITQGMLNGVINPFGDQSAEGAAFISDAILSGNLQNHKGKVTSWDGKVSRELGDWFGSGRKSAMALGAEYRREDFWSAANTPFAELVQASTGVDPTSVSEGTRNVSALYAELGMPITKTLELTAAVRYDNYSDFGSTTNPKFSLRYQPSKSLLFRTSYSTGFRAPSLYDINATPYYTNTGTVSDPINCPDGTNAIPGKSTVLNCNVQFQVLYGGNTDLQPEKSKNFTFGFVLEPVANLSLGVDFWWIELTDTIGSLSFNTILGDVAQFGQYINRTSAGDLSIDGFSCPGADCGYLDARTQNLGGTNTNGIDLSASYNMSLGSMGKIAFGLNTTYVDKYEYQDFANGPWNQNVGRYVGSGPIFRWQHTLSASWTGGAWAAGGVVHAKSSYVDQNPFDGDDNTVNPYETMDAYVAWSGMKGLRITAGVRNLFDRDPPFSNQGDVFQANYDPRFTNPAGRTYYLRASYQF